MWLTKDLETSDIKDTDRKSINQLWPCYAEHSSRFRTRSIQSCIDPIDHPPKVLLIHILAERSKLIFSLFLCSSLSNPFSSSSDFRSKYSFRKLRDVDAK